MQPFLHKEALTVVAKLSSLIELRYGGRVDLISLDQEPDRYSDSFIKLVKNNNPFSLDNKYYFPISYDHNLYAIAEIVFPPKTVITSEDLERLRTLLAIIESYLDAHYFSQHLKALEARLHDDLVPASNVVRLDEFRQKQKNSGVLDLTFLAEEWENTQTTPAKPPLPIVPPAQFAFPHLIEGSSSDDIFKMAFELHNMSQRWAFINYQDLDDNTRLSVPDLLNLGHVTLYIPNIADLGLGEQATIDELLSKTADLTTPLPESPQVVSGVLQNPIQLLQKNILSAPLLHKMSVVFLKLNQPFSYYKKMGLVDFLSTSRYSRPHDLDLI